MRKPWAERNAGDATRHVRAHLLLRPMTYDELVAGTGYSVSAVSAACLVLKAVRAGKGARLGTSGRFPTLWALPKERRR